MEDFKKHEIFEIEILDKLKSGKFLEPLVFGGGTMLRLCHELGRYSVDLDFWFIKEIDSDLYFEKMKEYFSRDYEVIDSKIKHFTLLLELRSAKYPKRLKIEIRKKLSDCDFQERIAFSHYASKQVMLKVHTLEQIMKNKINAALERNEIRDYFDLEFLLRRGIIFSGSLEEKEKIRENAKKFNARDYRVSLGSLLDAEERNYYNNSGFSYLISKLSLN